MRREMAFFDFSHGDGCSRQPSGGMQATGMGSSSLASMCKETMLGDSSSTVR
jgi:hypothetical protein